MKKKARAIHLTRLSAWGLLSPLGRVLLSHSMAITLDEVRNLFVELKLSSSGIRITTYLGLKREDSSFIPMSQLLTLCGRGTGSIATCLKHSRSPRRSFIQALLGNI